MDSEVTLSLDQPINYKSQRDYLRSSLVVFEREVEKIKYGCNVRIWSQIPIGKGLSSSSALCVGWTKFLHMINQKPINSLKIASLAHKAEVVEFNEPGGIMDHYTIALEKLIFLECTKKPKVEIFKPSPTLKNGFVIGDSLQTQDTVSDLTRLKSVFRQGFHYLSNNIEGFNPRTTPLDQVKKQIRSCNLSRDIRSKTIAILNNRDLTLQARDLFQHTNPDPEEIGLLLTKHHELLRDKLKCSTPLIEKMIQAATKAGAYGAKIVGSGSGGCMIALFPNDHEKIKKQIENTGAKAFSVDLLGY